MTNYVRRKFYFKLCKESRKSVLDVLQLPQVKDESSFNEELRVKI